MVDNLKRSVSLESCQEATQKASFLKHSSTMGASSQAKAMTEPIVEKSTSETSQAKVACARITELDTSKLWPRTSTSDQRRWCKWLAIWMAKRTTVTRIQIWRLAHLALPSLCWTTNSSCASMMDHQAATQSQFLTLSQELSRPLKSSRDLSSSQRAMPQICRPWQEMEHT